KSATVSSLHFATKRAATLAVVGAAQKPFQTFAPLNAGAKHPIQKYGFNYIEEQKKSARPLSPHLQIYAPQWTWYVSGGHRMTGVAMGIVVTVFATGMMASPVDFTTLINFFYSLNMPWPISFFLKFIIAYPVIFHAMNGVRFLGYDVGKGLKLETVYLTAYTVVGLAVIFALILASMKNEKYNVKK
uniref:Succinate dehydrogenase cytochrome b560 subunit, mitochondrial n=1 Tax=Romanomermis culicivorax TaxID=13658 RepID=A0A915L2R7_ROMCU